MVESHRLCPYLIPLSTPPARTADKQGQQQEDERNVCVGGGRPAPTGNPTRKTVGTERPTVTYNHLGLVAAASSRERGQEGRQLIKGHINRGMTYEQGRPLLL